MLGRRGRDDVELARLGGQRGLVEVVEVGVLEGVSRRDPPGGVVLEHLLQEVDADCVQLRRCGIRMSPFVIYWAAVKTRSCATVQGYSSG